LVVNQKNSRRGTKKANFEKLVLEINDLQKTKRTI
jgi:hypothetical protein